MISNHLLEDIELKDKQRKSEHMNVSPPILANVFYALAGLSVLAAFIFLGYTLRGPGAYSVGAQGTMIIVWVWLVYGVLLFLLLIAVGSVITYLHGTREYARVIAQKLLEKPASEGSPETHKGAGISKPEDIPVEKAEKNLP